MTIETVALLVAPVGGLILGMVVYFVATREAKRDLDQDLAKPVTDPRP